MKELLLNLLLLSIKTGAALPQNGVCASKHCKSIAGSISKFMDKSVDPCEDFSTFACGGFYKTQTIPGEYESFNTYSILEEEIYEKGRELLQEPINDNNFEAHKKAKRYYKACMNVKRQNILKGKPLMEILREIGGWPVLEGKKWKDQFDVWNASVTLRSLGYSANYLMSITIGPTLWNNTMKSIYINSPSLALSRKYLLKGLNETKVQAYLRY